MSTIIANSSAAKPSTYAWMVFLLGASFLFYKYMLQISPAVISHDLMRTFQLTGASLGLMVGFYFYTYLIMQIPAGMLLDHFGMNKLTPLMILLCAVGALLFSQTNSLALACLGRLLIGVGAAFASVNYFKVAVKYFPPQYFPLLAGLMGTASMTGAATAGAPLAFLANNVGWRGMIGVCSLIGLVLALVFWWVLRKPQGSQPVIEVKEQKFSWAAFIAIFKNKDNWPLIFYGGLAFTPVSVFGGLWGAPFLMAAHHVTRVAAGSAISLVFVGFAIGGIFTGFIGNRSKKMLPIMAVSSSLELLFLAVIVYIPHLPWWLLNVMIFGFGFTACSFTLSFGLARNCNPVALIATVIGIVNMSDPLCGGIAEPLIGKILDLNWQGLMVDQVRIFSVTAYQYGLSVLVLFLVLALVCCALIKERSAPVG